jgi:hypothetical protein
MVCFHILDTSIPSSLHNLKSLVILDVTTVREPSTQRNSRDLET